MPSRAPSVPATWFVRRRTGRLVGGEAWVAPGTRMNESRVVWLYPRPGVISSPQIGRRSAPRCTSRCCSARAATSSSSSWLAAVVRFSGCCCLLLLSRSAEAPPWPGFGGLAEGCGAAGCPCRGAGGCVFGSGGGDSSGFIAAIVPPEIVPPAMVPPETVPPWMVPPATVPPEIVPPDTVSPLKVAPSIFAPEMCAPEIVAPVMVAPLIVAPAIVAPEIVTPEMLVPVRDTVGVGGCGSTTCGTGPAGGTSGGGARRGREGGAGSACSSSSGGSSLGGCGDAAVWNASKKAIASSQTITGGPGRPLARPAGGRSRAWRGRGTRPCLSSASPRKRCATATPLRKQPLSSFDYRIPDRR